MVFSNLVYTHIVLYVVFSEKNYFTEEEHGYVYIIGMLYVDVLFYARPLFEHPTNGASKVRPVRVEQ